MLRSMVKLTAVMAAALALATAQDQTGSWQGVLKDRTGQPLAGARIELRLSGRRPVDGRTSAAGAFAFSDLVPGEYSLTVEWSGGTATLAAVGIGPGMHRKEALVLTPEGGVALGSGGPQPAESTGGEQLSGRQVSALPLNKRDFSQLLLLAAGTQTDANGAANFTQQFTVNGQRGAATVFAMDGIDTTDPEMGGATFSNFNVDAIQEINSSSGVLPASIGHGAAGFTEVITKSGTNDLHGSVFEFVRNAAFDARNFFDRRSVAQPGRIPPFNRNEFGFTKADWAGPSQSHLLVRAVPGFPPGAGNDPGAAGSDRAGAPGIGQHGLYGRRADRAGGPADRSGAGAVSAAQRPFRALTAPGPMPSHRRSARAPISSPRASTTAYRTRRDSSSGSI